jgi:hypothetical protein
MSAFSVRVKAETEIKSVPSHAFKDTSVEGIIDLSHRLL